MWLPVDGDGGRRKSLTGDFGFMTPLGEVKIPYTERGSLPVLRPPKVKVQAVRVAELKPLQNRATLEVVVAVTHRQGATLSFKGLDYTLGLQGSQVATGEVADVGAVSEGETEVVTLPVNLNLLQLGGAVVKAITDKSEVQIDLGGGVDVGTPLGVIPLDIEDSRSIQLR